MRHRSAWFVFIPRAHTPSRASFQDFLVSDFPTPIPGREEACDINGQGNVLEGISPENTYGKCILDSGNMLFQALWWEHIFGFKN